VKPESPRVEKISRLAFIPVTEAPSTEIWVKEPGIESKNRPLNEKIFWALLIPQTATAPVCVPPKEMLASFPGTCRKDCADAHTGVRESSKMVKYINRLISIPPQLELVFSRSLQFLTQR
jgi:hypothetical protein